MIIAFIPYVIVLLVFLFGTVWVGASLGLSGFWAILSTLGLGRALVVSGSQAWGMSTSYGLVALPLFVLMGELLHHGGFMNSMYARANRLLTGLPGGLLHSNIAVGTLFAACSGSSIASAATIGSVAYSEQVQRGYDKRMILGSIAGAGTLAILIPPSVIMILYGALVGESVGRLFIGGVIPGLILASMYSIYILTAILRNRSLVPLEVEKISFRERALAAIGLWQVGLLVLIILGGIYGGIATPTEVAAVGAVAALILTVLSRKLTRSGLLAAVTSTVKTTSMVVFITVGAKLFSTALVHYHIPPVLMEELDAMGLGPLAILAIVTILYVILGCFIDGVSMMVLTLGFVAPIMVFAGFDMIWFGIYLTVLVEMSLLTPPVGLVLYVLQGVSKEPLMLVVEGSVPYIVPQFILLVLLVLFPQLALWLPSLM